MLAVPPEIDPVTGADVDAQLIHATAHGSTIAEFSGFQTPDAKANPG
jgi:hypothetical protein